MEDQLLRPLLRQAQDQLMAVNAVQVYRGGEKVAAFNRLGAAPRLNAWSVSKSFVSVGVGIAMEEGLLSLDESVCDAFPEFVPDNPSPNLTAVTVRHLLTMTTGLADALFFGDDPQRYVTRDWLRHFFTADFDRAPGERFLYSNFNTYLLGCLIERRSGAGLAEYLRPRLFEPLGIYSPDWTCCPMGHCHAANGLYVTIDELARFGLLLLGRGEYGGRRVVSAAYLAEACRNQVPVSPENPAYGYQFWMNPEGDGYAAQGKYGQFVIVLPRTNTLVVAQSLDARVGFDLFWNGLARELA